MDVERKPEPLTAETLVRQFEERLWEADNHSMSDSRLMTPCYPMMFLSMGAGAAAITRSVRSGLKRLWPSYADKIAFVEAAPGSGGPVFTRPDGEALSESDIGTMTAGLFSRASSSSRSWSANQLLLYAALDTSGFRKPDELSQYLDALDAFRRLVRTDVPKLTLLTVLLNQDGNHRQTALRTRARLGKELSGRGDMPALLLVSNLGNDNLIDVEWKLCRRLLTAVVAVSNINVPQVVEDLFKKGSAMTAGYALAEKPTADISQICVKKLLKELKTFTPAEADDLFGENVAQTRERLGIGPDGCFRALGDYVTRKLPDYVPKDEELKSLLRAFPIRSPDVALSEQICERTSSEYINEQTFGAWNCYLEDVVRRARNGLQSQSPDTRVWEKTYYDDLRRKFHARELAELSGNLSKIRAFAKPEDRSASETSIRKTAEQRLKYLLSSDEDIREGLLDQIAKAGNEARDFLQEWEKLLQSESELREIVSDGDNKDFIRHYENQLDEFIQYRQDKLKEDFQEISDPSALKTFFNNVIDSIFEEKRLQKAFKDAFGDVGLMQIERTRATLTGAPVYLKLTYATPEPIRSFILLNVDKNSNSLYDNLKDDPELRKKETIFYNTGRGSEAESLNIYRLNTDEFWSGEADAES